MAALMSGNANVVKTSESVAWSSSQFASAIRSCLEACGHGPNIVQVLIGCEAEAARSLTRSKDISHLTFIGSDKVGKEIAKDAAENLLPVTLGLGGKVSSKSGLAKMPCQSHTSKKNAAKAAACLGYMKLMFISTGSLHTVGFCRCKIFPGRFLEGRFVSISQAILC